MSFATDVRAGASILSVLRSLRGLAGYARGGAAAYYARTRWLSSTAGRWLSRDILEYEDSMNLLQNVGNNPIRFVDPYGLISKREAHEQADAIGYSDANTVGIMAKYVESVILGYIIPDLGVPPGPEGNGPAGALQHCLWACLICKNIGKEDAKTSLDIHEKYDTEPEGSAMDLANNAVGLHCCDSSSCWDCCFTGLWYGGLAHAGGGPGKPRKGPWTPPNKKYPGTPPGGAVPPPPTTGGGPTTPGPGGPRTPLTPGGAVEAHYSEFSEVPLYKRLGAILWYGLLDPDAYRENPTDRLVWD